jgi:hypothetical protein
MQVAEEKWRAKKEGPGVQKKKHDMVLPNSVAAKANAPILKGSGEDGNCKLLQCW